MSKIIFSGVLLQKYLFLISSKWNSTELQNDLETLVEKYSKITKDLNSLDENDSIL